MSTNRETCFVIMPFKKTTAEHTEEYWTKHFEHCLKPLIEDNPNLEARRSKALRGDILRQIITDLVVSRVVVADLTDHNPNVYWELGVRQSFKSGTVTIAEVGTQLPFDIGAKGTLSYYPKDHLKMPDFHSDFKEAIQDCLINPDRPDSHVLETLSGRGTLFEIFRRDEALRRLDAVLSECNRNLILLNRVPNIIQNNKKNPTKRKFITERFGMSGIELLVTNRYVDEDKLFFDLAQNTLTWFNALNGELNLWPHSPDLVEAWLLRNTERATKITGRFRGQTMAARETLSKRF